MPMKRQGLQSALRVILLYLLFGTLWILVSDRGLEMLVADPHRITVLQTYKGWAFVFVSGLLLYFAVRREFHARARAEEGMKGSEEKYRILMETANDAIFVTDAETGTIVDANARAAELLGLPVETIIGMAQSEIPPREEAARCRGIFEEAVRTGRLIAGDICVSGREGKKIPVEISANVIELGGRKVLQSIVRDVTERKRAAETLEREKARAQTYLDIAGVIIVVIGADETVRLINKKGAEILGYEEREIIGRNWFKSFIPPRMRGQVRSAFQRLMSGSGELPEYFENPVKTRRGEERMIAWRNALVRDGAGAVIATLSSGEDITARKLAEEQARYRLEHLATLHAIDMIISSSLDLRVTLREFLDLVISQMNVDAADVLLLNTHMQTLEYAAGSGFRTTGIQGSRLRLGEGITGRAALEHRSISVPNLLDAVNGFVRTPLLEGEGFIAYYAVPLMAKGQVKGVLEILHRSPLVLDEEQRAFLEALAAQAAIAIDNAALFDELQRSNIELMLAYDATLEGWARALDLRSRATERHTERVTEMTLRLGRAMGLMEKDLVHVRRGALLHDIGKIGISDSILLKPGPLTEEEWALMRRHPVYAFEMLRPITYLGPALDIPYAHHEHWDGTGYPRGLKGEQIPLAARIFAVADVWDALVAEDRPYRQPLSKDEVREKIRSLAGTQLDPKAVEVFLKVEW